MSGCYWVRGVPVCETAMKVEWDSRPTRLSLRECVIWVWQWHNGIFLVNYRDLVHCESESVKQTKQKSPDTSWILKPFSLANCVRLSEALASSSSTLLDSWGVAEIVKLGSHSVYSIALCCCYQGHDIVVSGQTELLLSQPRLFVSGCLVSLIHQKGHNHQILICQASSH